MIRLGALGDVVRTLPSVRALREGYPEAHISWLVEPRAADVVRACGEIDEVIEFPRPHLSELWRGRQLGELIRACRDVVQDLRARHFDLVLDFHAILKSGLLAWATGAPVRISYARPFAREANFLFSTQRARLSPAKLSRYDRNAGLIEFLGLPARSALRLTPAVPTPADASVRDYVLIHPGSSPGTPYKRYRASGYADFAAELGRRRGASILVATGRSEDEVRLAEAIVDASRGAARMAPECERFEDLIALIGRARLFVGSDSGPLHIATALGIPAIQLIGATDPIENEPRGEAPWKQLRVDVPCSPCRRGCAAATCMSLLPHEWIVDAAEELLGESAQRASVRHEVVAPRLVSVA